MASDDKFAPRPTLTPFDVTSLVVGAAVGAGIYVVESPAVALMGPAMIVAWVIAGLMAVLIGLCFAQCAAILPRSGGAYAYAREAFGCFPGFLVGWMLYFSKLVTISVFPVAFVGYLAMLWPGMTWWQGLSAKLVLVAFVTTTSCLGSRTSGRINDVLAVVKLGPLLLLIVLGIVFIAMRPSTAAGNLIPVAPLGWAGLGSAVVLVYWAYAGFELAVIPSAEVIDSRKTLPAAVVKGLAIIVTFYLLVNVVVVLTMPWFLVASSAAPLSETMEYIMSALSLPWWWVGGAIMSLGALLSIISSNESVTIATSRLGLALAADGYLPRLFARLHPKYRTPYVTVTFQGVFAFVASLTGNLGGLIELSVFFMAFVYLSTTLATMRLVGHSPDRYMPFAGSRWVSLLALIGSGYLIIQADLWVWLVAGVLVLAGVVAYIRFAPRGELGEAQAFVQSEEHRLAVIEHLLLRAPAWVLQRIRGLLG